ncbi:MAG: hypothetical protein MR907_00235 [Firmicutes bacterium]|nr:hypothetical protein [Bacillota bacterium]
MPSKYKIIMEMASQTARDVTSNARANNSEFSSDSSYCLLSSLEVLDDEGNFVRKADMLKQ